MQTFKESLIRVPTVLENPEKSLNLFKKNPGLESPWKMLVLESPGIFFQ
jgi:hypothetical protein